MYIHSPEIAFNGSPNVRPHSSLWDIDLINIYIYDRNVLAPAGPASWVYYVPWNLPYGGGSLGWPRGGGPGDPPEKSTQLTCRVNARVYYTAYIIY